MASLVALLLLFVFKDAELVSTDCNVTYPGDTGVINLASGDSLCLPANSTFTGTVAAFPAGSKILVPADASFEPTSMPLSQGKLQNDGSCFLPALTIGSGFSLINNDTISL